MMSNDIKIVSLNVRGLRESSKRREMFNFLKKSNADIICLQETHSCYEEEENWCKLWGSEIVFSHGNTNSRGVAILFKKHFKHTRNIIAKDTEGRYIAMDLEHGGTHYVITNVYGPNTDTPELFQKIIEQLSKIENHNNIIIGDFNVVIKPTIDRIDGKVYNPKTNRVITELIENDIVIDIWRIRNPDKKIYSWLKKRNANESNCMGSRIDYALVSTGVANRVIDCNYSYGFRTDHSLFSITIDAQTTKRGPGYWKFNKKLLHDASFVNKTNEIIAKAKSDYAHLNAEELWQRMMDNVTNWAKEKSQTNAKMYKQRLNYLIQQYNKKRHRSELEKSFNINEIDAIRMQIEKIICQQTQSAQFRSKAKFTKDYERNSKFFFSLEKNNYNTKTMSRVYDEDGTLHTDPAKILKVQKTFYEKLYQRDPAVEFTFKNDPQFPTLNQEEQNDMDAPITLDELTRAIKSLKHDKTPGNTGMTAEFFQFFWSKIKEPYFAAIMFAKAHGRLMRSDRRGVIALIPKKQANSLYLRQWRPLTMLNLGYKILAKALANRLKESLPNLISDTQTAFLPGRQISSTLRTTIDITRYGKGINGYVLLLDFEKCFDRIAYTAITGSLKYLGFGNEFIKWTELLMTDFESKTSNNGFFSDYFNVERSCHQGCPVAPLLYNVCGEVLAREIRRKSSIRGIKINELEVLIAQFADDTQLFAENKDSVKEIIQTLSDIEANIGLKVNYEKSCILTIGNAEKFECDKPIVWDPGGVSVLGATILAHPQNEYIEIISKAKKVLNSWQHRNLSITGKVLLINTLVNSLFVYLMQIEESPNVQTITLLNNVINEFIWKGTKCKIPLAQLQSPKENAGLGLLSIELQDTAIKAAWIFREDNFSKMQLSSITPNTLGDSFWLCNLNQSDAEKYVSELNVNPFWQRIAICWFTVQWKYNHSCKEKELEARRYIWYNSEIRVYDKPIFISAEAEIGVTMLIDVLDKEGKPLTYENYAYKNPRTTLKWLQYGSIIHAIPAEWKNDSTVTNHPGVSFHSTIYKASARVRTIYNILAANNFEFLKKACLKMQKYCIVNISEMSTAFNAIRKTTNITKYRDFQYRLLIGAIYTNDRLFYWKKTDSVNCEYCNIYKQTIVHLMWECTVVQKVWKDFNTYVKEHEHLKHCEKELELNLKNIMLNCVHPKIGNILNLFVLVLKQHIFAQKCLGKKPLFNDIKIKYVQLYEIEKHNAIQSNTITKHTKKWQPFTGEINEPDAPTISNQDDYINKYIATVL